MTHVEYIIATSPRYGKVLFQFNGTPTSPSWMSIDDRSGKIPTTIYRAGGEWRWTEPYDRGTVQSTATGDGSNPPTTGWPAGYSAEILSPPSLVQPVSTIASPIILGLASLLTTSKSHDVAFSLKDGSIITAHRLVRLRLYSLSLARLVVSTIPSPFLTTSLSSSR
jgi:hypothetical protein